MTQPELSHNAEPLQAPHDIPALSPRGGDDLNTQNAGKTGRLKETVTAGLAELKIALGVADKFSDIIPLPGVSAVIGGLQVLLERQEV